MLNILIVIKLEETQTLSAGEETEAQQWELGHNLEMTPNLGCACSVLSDSGWVPQILSTLLKGVPDYDHLKMRKVWLKQRNGLFPSPLTVSQEHFLWPPSFKSIYRASAPPAGAPNRPPPSSVPSLIFAFRQLEGGSPLSSAQARGACSNKQ